MAKSHAERNPDTVLRVFSDGRSETMTHAARIVRALLFAATFAPAVSSAVQAAGNTHYISITGNNASPCTLAQPCRSLQKAIKLTPTGGEIRILDSGFYGNNATINKSLTINGNGNTMFLGTELVVNKAGVVVTLRNLALNGRGTVQDGIAILVPATVHIERCVFHGFADDGISVDSNGAEVFVIDTTARDNGDAGLSVNNGNTARISNSTLVGNGVGIVNAGIVETRGNNTVRGNDDDLVGTAPTPFASLQRVVRKPECSGEAGRAQPRREIRGHRPRIPLRAMRAMLRVALARAKKPQK